MPRGRPPLAHAAFWRQDARPVVEAAARAWRLSYDALMRPGRAVPLPEARFAAMLILHRRGWSYPTIAIALGREDHTTAIHGVRRARKLVATDPGFAAAVEMVEAQTA